MKKTKLIDFSKIGKTIEGYISIAEVAKNVAFDIKRVFWTYYTPESIIRGRHCHHETEMIIIALAGRIVVNLEYIDGSKETFHLETPNVGLYIPTLCWHTMHYSHNAVQLVLASTYYSESDYIRDYSIFKEMIIHEIQQ